MNSLNSHIAIEYTLHSCETINRKVNCGFTPETGTCDIDNVSADATQLAHDLFRLARRCVNDFGVKSVLFCTLLPRGAGRFKPKTADFTVKAELFNNTLKRLCSRVETPTLYFHVAIASM